VAKVTRMAPVVTAQDVTVVVEDAQLDGVLQMPDAARGLVVFAHGSGSSRFSSRNRFVARVLNDAGMGTLLFDLLTADENRVDERTREFRFDIELLARRLAGTTDWLGRRPDVVQLPIGLFGASTGAAAALIAAAERPAQIAAVVSRGGRPDLAERALSRVRAPTLLIVGSLDGVVIDMNRSAAAQLTCPHRVQIVAGATHLFEEPGKLEEAAELARNWFAGHFAAFAMPSMRRQS
jgi:putative phosphoribosyl transferase